ncbi:MAG: hypothetical protein IPJ88_12830 [Myxococcales bacterium]|nr:MAG: hypothetical protein IPJ88_12830 [Myxococcales bacterium]
MIPRWVSIGSNSDKSDLRGHFIYVDYADGQSCTSERLIEGEAPPSAEATGLYIRDQTSNTATSYSLDVSEMIPEFGQKAAIAVAAYDFAGNVSTLSNVACVTRQESVGIYESLCEGQGQDPADCKLESCSFQRGLSSSSVALLSVLGALLFFRRRRS